MEMIYIHKKLTCAPVTYTIVLAFTEALCGYQFILLLEIRPLFIFIFHKINNKIFFIYIYIFNITKTPLTCCTKCLKATHTVLYDFTYCLAPFPIWKGHMK